MNTICCMPDAQRLDPFHQGRKPPLALLSAKTFARTIGNIAAGRAFSGFVITLNRLRFINAARAANCSIDAARGSRGLHSS